jgi:hypothetical protein
MAREKVLADQEQSEKIVEPKAREVLRGIAKKKPVEQAAILTPTRARVYAGSEAGVGSCKVMSREDFNKLYDFKKVVEKPKKDK